MGEKTDGEFYVIKRICCISEKVNFAQLNKLRNAITEWIRPDLDLETLNCETLTLNFNPSQNNPFTRDSVILRIGF